MKKITLPNKAFPHERTHIVCGHTFKNGSIVVQDDVADKMLPVFRNFYGAEVENMDEEAPPETESSESSSDLTVETTKGD